MSWQAYVDTSLIGGGNCDKALICDAAGDAVWASSKDFSMTDAERKAIADSFKDKAEPKSIVAKGVFAEGRKYVILTASDEDLKAKQGKEGLVAFKTTQALLIAHHQDHIQTAAAFNDVAKLGEYLKSMGY